MTLTVHSRFRGPAESGNGGYVAGRLATHLGGELSAGPVTVTLHSPPPLDVPLDVLSDENGAALRDGETIVAAAAVGDESLLDVVPAVPVDEARAAMGSFPGLTNHPFPECFVCGPQRRQGDGMRLFPGRLGDGRTACVWDVTAELIDTVGTAVVVWAALDCPSGWSAPIEGRPMVLGRMTAQVDGVPDDGESCVVMGRYLDNEGRKTWTRSTVHGQDGRILGRAHATWIALPGQA